MFSHPLARDLARLFAVKLALLGLIYALCFAPSHRAPVDLVGRIMGSDAASTSPR